MGFFRFSFKRLLESFKLKKNSWYALGFQTLVLVSIIGVFFLYLFYGVMPFIDNLEQDHDSLIAGMQDISQVDEDALEEQLSLYNWFIFISILAVIGVFALFIFLTYFVWKFIKKSRFKWKYILKHVLVNVSILLFVAIVGFLFSIILQSWILPFFVIFVLLPLYIHLTTLLNSSLEKKPLENFSRYGIKKIHFFIFSHIIIFLGGALYLLVLMLGLNLMLLLEAIESNILFYPLLFVSFFILVVMFALYLVWSKKYVFEIFKSLKRDS